ncbi:platelet-activating factor acetylhydrolase isoform X1 [Peromyscus eremicus]|uniref:platelet-activating factor acetylhydrolase isoform X1 n=2 Tax=Peromyscus eremicus TaxID=42410 RepID=UPI0027DB94F7|nr:platelet-activating factor acetylhydrolase isoform X1 [Peromyscus eremicus]
MALLEQRALFCLLCCLPLVRPFHWQDDFRSSAWFHKIQAVMSAASSGHSHIPKGNGSYPVGCTDVMFGYAAESVFLRLYYPAQEQDRLDTVWIPNKEYFFGLSKFLGTPRFVGNILSLLYGSRTTPASWNSPPRTGEKYPLIVFSHGLGAFRTIYSAIGIGLASYGFIVATVEHRDESASATYYFEDQAAAKMENRSWIYLRTVKQEEAERVRKEQVRQRAKECSQALNAMLDIEHGSPKENILGTDFDLNQLKGAIDVDKIAVIGHSFGGATVIHTLSEDQRFKCGVALDPWMYPVSEELYSKIPQPLFFINSAHFQTPKDIMKMKRFYQPGKERKMITIRGSVHQNFADFTFVTGKIIGNKLTLKGEIDSGVAIDLTNKASLAFLQKHLGLHKDFNQWDSLVEGHNKNLIPGPPSDVVTQSPAPQRSPGSHTQN